MKTLHSNSLRCAAVLLTATLVSTLSAQSEALPNSAAPTKETTARANMTTASHSDRSFLEKALKAGMKEVNVSKAVEARLMNPEAKAFAQMMVAEHTTVDSELMALAARKGVALPTNDMKTVEKWSKKTKDIDEDYIKEMKEDHEEAVKLFEKASKSEDADIAAFARKTLPALQHHLSVANSLKKTVKP